MKRQQKSNRKKFNGMPLHQRYKFASKSYIWYCIKLLYGKQEYVLPLPKGVKIIKAK